MRSIEKVLIMECVNCYKPVAAARVAAGYNYCMACAEHVPQVKGVMVWGHKTAGEMQVVSPDQFVEHRKYSPYGKNTGMGSGVKRAMNSATR